jgi:hypothetical protein
MTCHCYYFHRASMNLHVCRYSQSTVPLPKLLQHATRL